MAKNLLAEKIDKGMASGNDAALFVHQVGWSVFHDIHLVFYVGGKAIVQIPYINKAKKKPGRSESLGGVNKAAIDKVIILRPVHPGKSKIFIEFFGREKTKPILYWP